MVDHKKVLLDENTCEFSPDIGAPLEWRNLRMTSSEIEAHISRANYVVVLPLISRVQRSCTSVASTSRWRHRVPNTFTCPLNATLRIICSDAVDLHIRARVYLCSRHESIAWQIVLKVCLAVAVWIPCDIRIHSICPLIGSRRHPEIPMISYSAFRL